MDISETEEGISVGRFTAIQEGEKPFRNTFGAEHWNGTEATATLIARKWRDASKALFHSGKHKPGTFNNRIRFIRQFLGWCEANLHLDRLPRDKTLFAKLDYTPSAKHVPIPELCKLFDFGTDLERCWILLALNCDYYASRHGC